MPAFKKVNKRKEQTKCTPEFIEKMCNFLRTGAYPETAAVMAGASKDTFLDWMRYSHPTHKYYKEIYADCRHAVEKAIAEAELRDLVNIDKCAMGQDWEYERHPDGTIDPESGRDISGHLVLNAKGNPIPKKIGTPSDWHASAWRLERRNPKRWARQEKIDVTQHEGKRPEDMTDEELNKLIAELEAKKHE